MVSDAIWTDFNNDGKMDLIVVGEFMPICFFLNNGSTFEQLTEPSKNTSGWWNKIIEGDFDNDGDTDYIIGNYGVNSQLKTSVNFPVTIVAKDFDDNGTIDPILCTYSEGKSFPFFSKDDLQEHLPFIKNRLVKYEDYANSPLEKIFTPKELENALTLDAKNFASSYLENLGNQNFDLRPLPGNIQFSPTYAIKKGDFNKDGNLDVLLGGNFTANRVRFGEFDASRGICLLGNGKGDFRSLKISESGLNIKGEIRAIEAFNDLENNTYYIFALNNAAARVFKLNENLNPPK